MEVLYATVDGSGLKEAAKGPKANWIDAGTALVPGGLFCNLVKPTMGVLTTTARSARGRDVEGRCIIYYRTVHRCSHGG